MRERERERVSSHFGSSRPAASLRGALEGGPVSLLLGAAGLPGGHPSERREARASRPLPLPDQTPAEGE